MVFAQSLVGCARYAMVCYALVARASQTQINAARPEEVEDCAQKTANRRGLTRAGGGDL